MKFSQYMSSVLSLTLGLEGSHRVGVAMPVSLPLIDEPVVNLL